MGYVEETGGFSVRWKLKERLVIFHILLLSAHPMKKIPLTSIMCVYVCVCIQGLCHKAPFSTVVYYFASISLNLPEVLTREPNADQSSNENSPKEIHNLLFG